MASKTSSKINVDSPDQDAIGSDNRNNETETQTMDIFTESKALITIFISSEKKAIKDFSKAIGDGGFENRLGKLMVAIREKATDAADLKQLMRKTGLKAIDRQRLAEAEWFEVNRETDIVKATIKDSKKGFSSIGGIQNAIRRNEKKEKASDETPKGEGKDESPKGEDKGEETPKGVLFHELTVDQLVVLIERNFNKDEMLLLAKSLGSKAATKKLDKVA
tara:strand:+ start:206 stop:865 length:660 start_codon:yes stop_codon:yes gene_type:complete